MEELTNQTVDSMEPTSDDLDWFSDVEVDTPDETTQEAEQNVEAPAPTSFMTIKYNGQDKPLSQEEAITMAQKGMNYDKVFGELQGFKQHFRNADELNVLVEMANSAGLDVPQYLQRMQDFQNNAMVQNIAENLKEKYPDAPDGLIQEMAKNQFEKQTNDKRQMKIDTETAKQKADKANLLNQIQALESQYPDVDINQLPDEVIAMAAQGETLLSAYRAYELKQLREQISNQTNEINALKKNHSNKQKSTGSLTGRGGNDEMDAFLDGFNS